jgi:hypothetical protein
LADKSAKNRLMLDKAGDGPSLVVAGPRVERGGDPSICEDLPAQAKFLLLPHRCTFVVIVYTLNGNPV